MSAVITETQGVARVAEIRRQMSAIKKEVLTLADEVPQWQWGAFAFWQVEAELSLFEAMINVGIVPSDIATSTEYMEANAAVVGCLKGQAAKLQFLARWDQVQALGLTLLVDASETD